jgi:1-aminocyclopropane-1-carboxylate deaminase/D-cysteine desulfhydrase-like pyridoxal-dependent ACC family enzyme
MSIPDRLSAFPRAGLIQAPAIIHALPRLSSMLGLELFVLRDDLTGFGIGGNKTRKLDFLLGDALARGASSIATIKATSFSRNAAAALLEYARNGTFGDGPVLFLHTGGNAGLYY